MRPRGQTPWMRPGSGRVREGSAHASMRPRGQTPWMRTRGTWRGCRCCCFNEATGADPVDARLGLGRTPRCRRCFNEATGADPVDARPPAGSPGPRWPCFNEATGADPVDARAEPGRRVAVHRASMRPRGQTPWMHRGYAGLSTRLIRFNEATGADPVDARRRGPDRRRAARFNEATGADPVDASATATRLPWRGRCFNEATGADPVDARAGHRRPVRVAPPASMRPRGQTPWMLDVDDDGETIPFCFNEATGADPVDALEAGLKADLPPWLQ